MSQCGLTAMISPVCWIWMPIWDPVCIHDCCHCSSHTAGHSILSVNGNHCAHCVCLPGRVRQSHLERWFITEGDILKESCKDPGAFRHTHMKISMRTCPSEPFIICMAETQQASVTQGCGDKPKLQTQTSPKTFIGESLECSSASGYSITPAEGKVICVHGLVTGSNVCNHSTRATSPTLVL